MSKVVLNDLANLQNENTAVTKINQNSSIIEDAFDNTLSRDGANPNQMMATLDMNSNQIINLPQASSANSPVRKADIDSLTLTGIAVSTPGILTTDGSAIFSRTITGTENEVVVTNETGSADNPTISLPSTLTFTGKTVTGGTFNDITLNGALGLSASDIAGLSAVNCVSRVALSNIDPTKSSVAFLLETYRVGTFIWMVGDYSAQTVADPNQGLYVAHSTIPVTQGVWVRNVINNEYQVDWWRTSGNSIANDTIAVKAALESVPSGSTIHFTTNTQYNLNTISATTKGHLTIQGHGALIYCSSQVYSPAGVALPILRVYLKTQNYNLTVENLKIQGPRSTSDTNTGVGDYGGNPLNPGTGYPSGLDVPIGNYIKIKGCSFSNTFYAGVEIHYANKVIVEECTVFTCAFAGIVVSDTVETHISKNTVYDIGAVMITNGYGINMSTSYNTPSYTYYNTYARITDNVVSSCKRKGIDAHNCLRLEVTGNSVTGCAYEFIYAVCEGVDKRVGDINVNNNKCYGDPSFNGGITQDTIISVGSFSGVDPVSLKTNFNINNNFIRGVNASSGISFNNNNTVGKEAVTILCNNNVFTESVFSACAIFFNNSTEKNDYASVCGNLTDCTATTAHIYIRSTNRVTATSNMCSGTTGAATGVLIDGGTVGFSVTANNSLNGTLDT